MAPFHRPDVSLRGSDLHRTIEEMQLSLNLTSLKQSPTQGIDQLTAALLVRTSLHIQVIRVSVALTKFRLAPTRMSCRSWPKPTPLA